VTPSQVLDERLFARLAAGQPQRLEALADIRVGVRHEPFRSLHHVRVGVVNDAAFGIRHPEVLREGSYLGRMCIPLDRDERERSIAQLLARFPDLLYRFGVTSVLCVAARFCGIPGAANGGYLAGRLAEIVGGAVEVTFRRATPLERDVTVRPVRGGAD